MPTRPTSRMRTRAQIDKFRALFLLFGLLAMLWCVQPLLHTTAVRNALSFQLPGFASVAKSPPAPQRRIPSSSDYPTNSSSAYAARVREAMVLNFNAYWTRCPGGDEYEPAHDKCNEWFGMGLTAIDSIDTLLIMGLHREYDTVRKWAATSMNVVGNHKRVSTFELIIRVLGGLNSAFALTKDKLWLTRAVQLGDAVLHAFSSYTSCPSTEVTLNPQPHVNRKPETSYVSTSEAGSLQLEMRTLSRISGDMRYKRAADRCEHALIRALPTNRVVPLLFDRESGYFSRGSRQTVGAHVDSFIEMLLKTWIAFGRRDDTLRVAFERQVEEIFINLASFENNTALIGVNDAPEDDGSPATPPSRTMEHLACFFPGALALGALHGLGGGAKARGAHDYMTRAHRLARTCFRMSLSNSHGLAPEIINVDANGTLAPAPDAAHSLLRPEVVESLYILHAITGDKQYRQWGMVIWDGIVRSGTLHDGRLTNSFGLDGDKLVHRDKLNSFVLAETLKYLFLLFREDGDGPSIDLKEWVFNTEAHPVPVSMA